MLAVAPRRLAATGWRHAWGRVAALAAARGPSAKLVAASWREPVQARGFSMPSRADTRPLALTALAALPCAPAETDEDGLECWVARTSAGVFTGPAAAALSRQAKRAHTLSPLVPAEAVLRIAVQRGGGSGAAPAAAIAALAEQTLSLAVLGGAAAWVLRGGAVIAGTSPSEAGAASPGSACAVGGGHRGDALAVVLRPGDIVALVPVAGECREEELLAVASAGHVTLSQLVVWLRCVDAEASEVWAPLRDDAPHPSWSRTIFNEYGTHSRE